MNEDHRCGACAHGRHRADGFIRCEAPVDRDCLRGCDGLNPVWAERTFNWFEQKYGMNRMGIAALKITIDSEIVDPERMPPHDGATCKMWQREDYIVTFLEGITRRDIVCMLAAGAAIVAVGEFLGWII